MMPEVLSVGMGRMIRRTQCKRDSSSHPRSRLSCAVLNQPAQELLAGSEMALFGARQRGHRSEVGSCMIVKPVWVGGYSLQFQRIGLLHACPGC